MVSVLWALTFDLYLTGRADRAMDAARRQEDIVAKMLAAHPADRTAASIAYDAYHNVASFYDLAAGLREKSDATFRLAREALDSLPMEKFDTPVLRQRGYFITTI
jgi:hypothetical protein